MMEYRTLDRADFQTRAEGEDKFIEGYFSVFNSPYPLWGNDVEFVAPGAFKNTLGGDIRALINHEARLVLGRTAAGTLELKEDDVGLWGRIKVNPNDSDAMNLYERVRRGDVTGCSFGFSITREDTEVLPDGATHYTIEEVELFEVSVCTWPAYEATHVDARSKESDERAMYRWKQKMLKRLKGE